MRSCRNVRSPIRANAGPAVHERRADGGGDRAVDAGDAAVGQHREVAARHRQPVDVPHRRGGAEHQQRTRRAAPRPCRAPAAPRSAAGAASSTRVHRRADRRGARAPRAEPPGGDRLPGAGRRHADGRPAHRRPRGVRPARAPAAVSTRTAGSASSARPAATSVGRPTTSTRSGRCAASQPAAPSSRAPPRSAPAAAQAPLLRLGDHRPATGVGERGRGAPQRRRAVARRRAACAAAAGRRPGRRAEPAVRRPSTALPPGRPAQGPSSGAGLVVGQQRLAQRQVQVHRARVARDAHRTRSAAPGPTSDRQYRFCAASRPASGTPTSAAQRTAPP